MKTWPICLALLLAPATEPPMVGFDQLAGFDYQVGMALPQSVTKYDQQTVRLTGFMARETEGTGQVEFFLLINDACGCEGTPKLNEIVYCAMPEGETTEILPGTVTVTGTMFVGEQSEEGIVIGIYALDVDAIKGAGDARTP